MGERREAENVYSPTFAMLISVVATRAFPTLAGPLDLIRNIC
jgi:hypothetical protein